jgi:hypothetical protein
MVGGVPMIVGLEIIGLLAFMGFLGILADRMRG